MKRKNTGKTPSLWSITANCTKFNTFSWNGMFVAQEVQTEHRASSRLVSSSSWVVIFVSFTVTAVQRRVLPCGRLVAVASIAQGVVDPVQDDEGHAAEHDQESAEKEGCGLCRRMGFSSHARLTKTF